MDRPMFRWRRCNTQYNDLANDIRALDYKISILDKTAFSCEEDCKRTEQQVQELTDQKNRIGKGDCKKYIEWRRRFNDKADRQRKC